MTIEEAGKTARSLINGLSSSPLVLALVVICMSLVVLLYWQAVIGEGERQRSLELLYKNRTEVGELLLRCQKDGDPPPHQP